MRIAPCRRQGRGRAWCIPINDVDANDAFSVMSISAVVPEPGTGLLLAFGLLGLARAGRTRADVR